MTAPTPRLRKRTIVRSNSYGLWFARASFAGLGRFAPALADRQATRLFFTPSPRRAAEPGAISGREPERFTVTVGKRRMRCWRYGSGPVVVFVHGWSGSARDWTSVAARVIDEGFTAVLCDFPAHGGSDGRQTDLPEMSRALHALADELAFGRGGRVEPLHAVVAHSFGGAATALAARDGLLSGSIVLLAPVA